MNSSEIVDTFISEVQDLDTPRLWPDDEAFGYLDDAQKQFCRLTGGLGDSMASDVTQLPVVIDGEYADLSDKILKIRGAYRLSDGKPVEVVNFEDMPRLGITFDGRTGPVAYLIIGMTEGHARFYPVPSVADAVQLVVDRLPLEDITLEDAEQELEIAPQHHRHLTLWMRHLAYSKQDSEGYDRQKAMEFEQKFLAYCAKATNEKARAKHKTRIVNYGGL